MPNFPDRITEAIDPMRTARAAGLERRAEGEVLRHGLRAWVVTQKDQIDSQTVRDAVETAFDEEVDFYDHGIACADGSLTKQELLARKLDILSRSNNRRILRRFG
jgi:hypothetical protein